MTGLKNKVFSTSITFLSGSLLVFRVLENKRFMTKKNKTRLNKYDRNVRLSKIKNKWKPNMATHYAEEIKFNQTINHG